MPARMHDDEIPHDVETVRTLLATQQPQWAGLPVEYVPSTGTDNALYRLGEDLVVRLPLRPASTRQIDRVARWLPVLAPHLPLAVPVPVATGEPTDFYPWTWSVVSWLRGEDATTAPLDRDRLGADLAEFIAALRGIDPTGGPRPSAANFGRGVPLALRDAETRRWIDKARGLVDTGAVAAAWDEALRVPAWDGPPVWLHGDIASGNLLVEEGRVTAVIDWGALGVGDPACDLIVAWEMLEAAGRDALRARLGVDDDTWARGRGWALSTAIIALPYYDGTNAFMADQARSKLAAVLAD
jgi:aminoglycoside phosphotransferase (APT) family kinase protein